MHTIVGTSNRGLEIDLDHQTFSEFKISEKDRELFIGGKGLALKMLSDRLKPGIEPLSKDNVIVFDTGVMMGIGAPCSGRFAVATKSPLTGITVTSSCGGPFGMALKTAGYDSLIVKGKSKKPVLIKIESSNVIFEDAATLWGKDTFEIQSALKMKKNEGAVVIGPAGENLGAYANVASGHRFFGRGGVGAVFGSKNVKAIVVKGGEYGYEPYWKEKFSIAKKRATKYINRNEFSARKYRPFGTASHVGLSNTAGILPVNNFQKGSDTRSEFISGEYMNEKYNPSYSTCKPCTILCGHRGKINGKDLQIPEYETTALLGSNLGVFDSAKIAEWNELCGRYGLDTITLGGTLAWAMEATEKGLIKTSLKFGEVNNIESVIKQIAYKEGLGQELANGSRWLSEKYGGKDFAIHVKGMEIAAYDPRGAWGQGLAYAVANRGGCHLSGSMFAPEAYLGFLNPYSVKSKARLTIFFEDMYSANNCLQLCHFLAYPFLLEAPIVRILPKPIIRLVMRFFPIIAVIVLDVSVYSKMLSAVLGKKISQNDFIKIGRRVHLLERQMNIREGITNLDDTLPGRFLNENGFHPKRRLLNLSKMLKQYYALRKYTTDGNIKASVLNKLQIPHNEERKL